MNVAMVVVTVVLLIQGTRIVVRAGSPPFVRCFGLLTLLLAGLSFVLFAILFWGEAILSPEFDVVMARGHWRGLVVLVIGFAVAAGLGLHVQRLKAGLPRHLGGLLFLGLAVGAAAASRIKRLHMEPTGEDAARAFWIYSYDLWWPPLLIWLSACFLDGAITVLGVSDRRVRTGAFLAMLVALSLRARSRQVFTDPTSAVLWKLALVLAALGCLLFVFWLAWRTRLRPVDGWRLLRAAAQRSPHALRRHWRRAVTGGWPGISGQMGQALRPMAGQILAVLALATIAGSLADIFYIGWLPQAGALVILAVAWTCLAEATAQGPLRAFVVNVVPEVFGRLAHQGSWFRQGWLLLRERLAGPLSRLGDALRRLVSLRPFPEALMKIGVLFVVMVVAYEIPHAGKTLLQPFTAVAVNVNDAKREVPTVSPQAEIGRAVFDHLINTLGALTVDLQPDVILLLPPDPERGARFRTLAAGGAGSIDPFLAQGLEIDLGGVKVPTGFLLTPVLQPVRWLLGVRVVNGSVLADPQGYTVLVRSSTGDMWRARLTNKNAMLALSAGDDEPATQSVPDLAFNRLALELAFRIMSAEPALAAFGMTRSWDAFEEFRGGLESWREFTLHRGLGDPDALSGAIQHFRAASAIDPTFALAHYRLGVALHNDGQPLAAAEALRASLRANPGFVPAMVALASVLYSSEDELGVPLFGRRRILDDDETRKAKLQEARRLWESVISAESGASSLDRAAAWAGLCRHALDEPERRNPGSSHGRHDEQDSLFYRIAYFYCQQAERLYAALVATPREDLRVKTARASGLASIGMLLERHGPRRDSRETKKGQWQCARTTIDENALASDGTVIHNVPTGHYTRAALGYYRRALKLLPDDSVLRCREASAEFAASEDRALMRALETEATSRWNLAESYRHEARRHLASAVTPPAPTADRPDPRRLAAAYFGLALTEYAATQQRDPTNFEALNRYAHVFWEWRYGEANANLPTGPDLVQARLAESSARKAIAMAEAKRSKPVTHGPDTGSGGPAARPDSTTAIAPAKSADPASAASSAVALADQRDDAMPKRLRASAATAHASLGAVLVAQTRPHEAIDVLESARRYVSEHPSFDHVQWMLAQAHLCAAAQQFRAMRDAQRIEHPDDPKWRDENDPRLEPIGAHREKARPPLDIIRAHERARESPAFAGLTDISRSDRICWRDWLSTVTKNTPDRVVYQVKQEEEDGNYRGLCRWLGVRMELPDGRSDKEEEPVFLHVWGGTVNERVQVMGPDRDQGEARDGRRRQNVVPIIPTSKPFYYFAQLEKLENAVYMPVSLPVALKEPRLKESTGSPASPNATPDVAATAAPPASDAPRRGPESRCPGIKNLIQLTLDPIGPGTARAAPRE